jgi:uncharacterized DUF497 family protein
MIHWRESLTMRYIPLMKGANNERREIIIGHSVNERLLLVSFAVRPSEMIRIISARTPTKKERKDYEETVNRKRSKR